MQPTTTFGHLPDGTPIRQYTLTNRSGATLHFLDYGGIVTSLQVQDPSGHSRNIMLGFKQFASYLVNTSYLGAIIGRFANRIKEGRFSLNGREYSLAQNNNGNHLHGGLQGFDKQVWRVNQLSENKAELHYHSPDGEEGYLGNLNVKVTYELTEANEWIISYEAESDQDTILNLTHHAYFNLDGQGTVHDHRIRLLADAYIPINNGIPLADAPHSVEGTPFDLREWHEIGAGLASDHPQIAHALGYDHCFVCRPNTSSAPQLIAEVQSSDGLTMQVRTTQPGVQLFTGNYPITGAGEAYSIFSAFCLETQHFPDTPNRPDFPSVVLKTGEIFRSQTVYSWVSPIVQK